MKNGDRADKSALTEPIIMITISPFGPIWFSHCSKGPIFQLYNQLRPIHRPFALRVQNDCNKSDNNHSGWCVRVCVSVLFA